MLSGRKRLEFYDLTFKEKVTKLFEIFPFKLSASETLLEEIKVEISVAPRGHRLRAFEIAGHPNVLGDHSLTFTTVPLGIMYWTCHVREEPAQREYEIRFAEWEQEQDIHSDDVPRLDDLSLDEARPIVLAMLPFFLSEGKDKKTVPLLINSFTKFAHFAFKYDYAIAHD